MSSTVYDIDIRMKLAKSSMQTNRGIQKINRSISNMGRAVKAVAFGAVAAKGIKSLVGYNKMLEDTKIQLSSIFQGTFKGEWADNMERASGFMKQLKEDAAATPGTFQDLAVMAKGIANHVAQAGGSMDDIRNISKGAVVSGAIFGESTGVITRDIQGAISGQLRSVDRFMRQLIAPMGYTIESWNNMVRKKPGKGLTELAKAFDQKHIREAGKAYETSMTGGLATLKSSLQEVMGAIGKPLTEELTKEITRINVWLKANQDRVKQFGKDLGANLLKGFKMLKEGMEWLYKNRETIKTLAIAFVAMKGIGKLSAGAGGIQAMMAGTDSAGKKLGGFASGLGKATFALQAAAIAAGGIKAAFDKMSADRIKRRKEQEDFEFFRQQIKNNGGLSADENKTFMKKLRDGGYLNAEGALKGNMGHRAMTNLKLAGDSDNGQTGVSPFQMAAEINRGRNRAFRVDKVARSEKANSEQAASVAAHLERQYAAAAAFSDRASSGINSVTTALVPMSFAGTGAAAALDGVSVSMLQLAKSSQPVINAVAAGIGGFSIPTAVGKGSEGNGIKPTINATIKMEIASDDPDRFAMGLETALQDWASNPSQALNGFEGNS